MESSDKNIVHQYIRRFTVQIKDYNGAICGTGFVIYRDSTECLIVTCRHVIEIASEDKKCTLNSDVSVYFPQIYQGKTAKVLAYLDEADDDIAIVQLQEKLPPRIKAATIAAFDSQYGDHDFKSYGFREVGDVEGLWTTGRIDGSTGTFANGRKLKTELIQLYSDGIKGGMSGSPVLDLKRNLVIGMISEKYYTNDSIDRDLAFAVDSLAIKQLLPSHKFKLYQKRNNPLDVYIPIDIPIKVTSLIQTLKLDFPLKPNLQQAPKKDDWGGRTDWLRQLEEDWDNPNINLICLYGFWGEGKTVLVRHWLEGILDNRSLDGILWIDSSRTKDSEFLIDDVADYIFSEEDFEKLIGVSLEDKVTLVGRILFEKNVVVILDGFEKYQYTTLEQYGQVNDSNLKRFLEFFLSPECQSTCIVTSRASLTEFSHTTVRDYHIDSLEPDEALTWLTQQIQARDSVLMELIRKWNKYPLALSIIAAQIKHLSPAQLDTNILKHLPEPDFDKSSYHNLGLVIKYSFDDLNEYEKDILKLVSAIGQPIPSEALVFLHQPRDRREKDDEIRQNITAITNHLEKINLLCRNESGDYYVHKSIADECRNLVKHYDDEQIKNLLFDMACYHFSQMLPGNSLRLRKRERDNGLYYLYKFFDLLDDETTTTKIWQIYSNLNTLPADLTPYILGLNYILIRKLGKGATGEVWSVFRYGLDRLEAIKFLEPDFQNLGQELRVLASLSNQNVVRVVSRGKGKIPGDNTERFFFTMPYLQGGTLSEKMEDKFKKNENFAFAEVQQLLDFIASGLDYLHRQEPSIFHEDMKPANIVYDELNIPIIVDFGFSRLRETSKHDNDDDVPGTASYMAPEKWAKAQGASIIIEAASDQYSVAIIIYEMLTNGKWPYDPQHNERDSHTRHYFQNHHMRSEPIPVRQYRSDFPEAGDAVILRALSKRPIDRYATMQEFASAFGNALLQTAEVPQSRIDTSVQTEVAEIKDAELSEKNLLAPDKDEKEPRKTLPARLPLFLLAPVVIVMLSIIGLMVNRVWTLASSTPTLDSGAIQAIETQSAAITETALADLSATSAALTKQSSTSTANASATETEIAIAAVSTMTATATEELIGTPSAPLTNPLLNEIATNDAYATNTQSANQTASAFNTQTATALMGQTATADANETVTTIANQTATTVTNQSANETATVSTTHTAIAGATTRISPTFVPAGNSSEINQTLDGYSQNYTILAVIYPPCDTEPCERNLLYVTKSLISNEQYRDCWSSSNGPCNRPFRAGDHFNLLTNSDKPVVDITWEMAYTYCGTYGGRLPTELEWNEIVLREGLTDPNHNEWTSPAIATLVTPSAPRVGLGGMTSLQNVEPDYYERNLGFRCVFEPNS